MVWILEQENTTVAIVDLEVDPPCPELSPPLEYFKENNLMQAYGRWTRSGIDIEDRFWPRRATLKSDRKTIPGLIGICSFWAVSERFKDCVESLEPGLHDFRNVEIYAKDQSIFHEEYYALNIKSIRSGAVIWDETEVPFKELGGHRRLHGLLVHGGKRRITMRSEDVSGLHLWVSQDTMSGSIAVSDQLYLELSELKLLAGVRAFPVFVRA